MGFLNKRLWVTVYEEQRELGCTVPDEWTVCSALYEWIVYNLPCVSKLPQRIKYAIWSRSSVTKGIEPSDKKHPCRHCQVGKGEGGVAGDFNCVVYK